MTGAAQTDEERLTHLRAAADRFQQSLAISRRIGDEPSAASTLNELGKLLQEAGQMREAIDAHTEALEIYRRANNPFKVGLTLEFLGSVHARQGQYAPALEKFQQALKLFKQYASQQYVADMEWNIARVQAKLRDEDG